ncbi:Cytochrome c oxidase subunit 6 [Lodderomyces elongisporus]|uniref:Cytochrome c oxidase subunit 6, mitochondrial n=1 Tax=Lodderomyces elongisporus (strain ATCC 11503 / CBS 2605 / JCM 1781 / NBRC 1676 / NRRL YB-4239) TaxID=379508 RepID=A5DV95_LODEL|nr:Cytochrome c oxidase subunit 6 [Lodderomyces elongisporus]EDK43103.1 cytochrome c oxidase polypeptide VI, mitochondrial precursor [Lodderomyces elongisporus NRRL YB-4239]WLF77535.1 Cytochrome c oxidase subunit 6 [Lodderomyces elongisporus]
MLSSIIKRNINTCLRTQALTSASLKPLAPKLTTLSIASIRNYSAGHHEETFEEFTARYESEFENAYDLFEVQRVLNNVFSYDLVPAPVVIEKALQACRRVNDYPTAVRTFEALKYKVETPEQYAAYLEELKDIRKELGIDLKEDLYGNEA